MKRVIFVLLSGALVALFMLAMWQDTTREWTHPQQAFRNTLAKEERSGLHPGIHQMILADLNRVDRCTTCHVAIDKPQLALAEEPFTAHPGRFLEWHPPERFGCTVCHGGQGLATEVKAAHGDVPHWEEPLLRGSLVQASCYQCHGDLAPIAAYAPQLVRGKALFEAKGCYGCHTIKAFGHEFGGTISQDLSDIGAKPYELIKADFEMLEEPHTRIHWLLRKLAHPRALNPGSRPEELPPGEEEVFPSAMPHFGLAPDEAEAITTYLLSLRGLDLPSSYVRPPKEAPQPVYASVVERGRAMFEKFGCNGCHGAGGAGGRRNWNAGLGQEVPSLLYVKAYYGNRIDALKDLIRDGRQPAPRADPTRPFPSLYMPSWKGRIPEGDLDALTAYLFSLHDQLPAQPAMVSGAAQAAASDAPPEAPAP